MRSSGLAGAACGAAVVLASIFAAAAQPIQTYPQQPPAYAPAGPSTDSAQAADQDPAYLAEQLRRVQQQLRDLQGQIYRNAAPVNPGDPATAAAGPAVPQNPQRLADLEQSLQSLTGQVEDLAFQVKRLQDQYAAFQRDTQFRLSALEGGAPSSLSSAVPPATAGGPSPMTLGPQPGPSRGGAPGPGTLGTLPASAAPALASSPGALTADEQYKAALNLLSKQQYAEAQGAFRQFVTVNPKHELAGTAQFFAADIDFVQKNYPAAAQGFTSVLRTYPKSSRAPDAMLKLGLSLLQAGDKKNGCLTLGAIKQKYPSANGEIVTRAQRARTTAACI